MRKSFVIFYRKMFLVVDKKWRFGYSKGGKNFQSKGREEMFSLAPCLALLDSAEEQEAFLALYHRYNRLVLHQAKKIVGKEEWAEDVMQEVFIYIAVFLVQPLADGAAGGLVHRVPRLRFSAPGKDRAGQGRAQGGTVLLFCPGF